MSAVDTPKARKPEVRGACPGALRPMESGDGLIVRVRPRAGAITSTALRAIADAAERYGNGAIDLTRRANLQLRGIRLETLADVQHLLHDHDLLDASAEAESVRNILVSPLAGIDPTAHLDVRPLARALEARLATDADLWRLPPKFSFVIDGGGLFSLSTERADLRLTAMAEGTLALGVDGPDGVRWLGFVAPEGAIEKIALAAKTYLELSPTPRLRLSSADDQLVGKLSRTLDLAPFDYPSIEHCTHHRVGLIAHEGHAIAVGVMARFGRIEPNAARMLAHRLEHVGADEVRLSPWRALYIPVHDIRDTKHIVQDASRAGFIVDETAPIIHIDACPGAPACPCASQDTREAAEALAQMWDKIGVAAAHVSGCTKGCARSAAADLVLVGNENGFDIVMNGRADSAPCAHTAAELRELLHALAEARHG